MRAVQGKKSATVLTVGSDREPIACGIAVAERFMKIHPPRKTYMYKLGMAGLLDLYEATGEKRFLDFVLAQERKEPHFHFRLYELTGDRVWLTGAQEVGERFLANPRRDREGALLDPRGRYTIDVAQGYFTSAIMLGHVLTDGRYLDEACRQFDIARGYLEDPVTGLWYNRWGHGLHPCRPNPGLWGRGNGWLTNSWGRVAHLWDAAHPKHGMMREEWQKYCRSVEAFQTDAGLFRQLLNRPESFEDATASGLIGAGIGFGVLHGTLLPEMAAVTYRAARGLNHLVDESGSIYNASTTAGGYNFEQQYESCPIFNDPHGDGSVMAACAAAHMILKKGLSFDRTAPPLKPVIVTQPVPGLVSFEQPTARRAVETAAPVLRRLLELEDLPPHDLHGSTILGLLHWHDFRPDGRVLAKASRLFARASDRLPPVDRWRVACELARRTGQRELPEGLAAFVDGLLAGAARDRCGVMLDSFGGYSIDLLYGLLPLLASTGALTGDGRCFDEACLQLFGHQNWLEEPITRLWHSAFGRGAHPRRVTPGFWALGNAYCLAGLVDLLDHLPPDHQHYVDAVCLMRGLVEALHEWLPVFGGWSQVLNDYDTFRCVSANGLLTYGCAKPVWRGWVKPAYYAAVWGGLYHLGHLVRKDGDFDLSSLPAGGLDTLEAYSSHCVKNDPSALGFILSGCAYGGICQESGREFGEEDERLGAR